MSDAEIHHKREETIAIGKAIHEWASKHGIDLTKMDEASVRKFLKNLFDAYDDTDHLRKEIEDKKKEIEDLKTKYERKLRERGIV